jgi:hypothetical protein
MIVSRRLPNGEGRPPSAEGPVLAAARERVAIVDHGGDRVEGQKMMLMREEGVVVAKKMMREEGLVDQGGKTSRSLPLRSAAVAAAAGDEEEEASRLAKEVREEERQIDEPACRCWCCWQQGSRRDRLRKRSGPPDHWRRTNRRRTVAGRRRGYVVWKG